MKDREDEVLRQTAAEVERSRKLRQETEKLLSKVAKSVEADKRSLQKAKRLRRHA
jgi:hypothetical protein